MDRSESRTILLLFLPLLLLPVSAFPSFAIEPQDTWVLVNNSVKLNCRVYRKEKWVGWLRNGIMLAVNNKTICSSHCYIVDHHIEGNFNLLISPVQSDDEGMYQCMTGTRNHSRPIIFSRIAYLKVVEPQTPAYVENGEIMKNTEMMVACGFNNKTPTLKTNWNQWFGDVMAEDFKEIIASLSDHGIFTKSSVLKVTFSRDHYHASITCQAESSVEATLQNVQFRFQILSIPRGNKHERSPNVYQFCDKDSDPPILTFSWLVNGSLIVKDTTTPYDVHNITLHNPNDEAKCRVSNFVDDLQFEKESKTVSGVQETVTMTCEIKRNRQSTTQFIHKDTKKEFGTNMSFSVKLNNKTTGEYICGVDLTELEETTILMNRKPIILSDVVQFGILGKDVLLKCLIHTTTKSNYTVIWSFNGNIIDAADKKHTILEDYFPQGIESTLVIKESSPDQFGSYNCSVTNPYGSDNLTILLKQPGAFSYYFIGIISVFLTISIVLYLYLKRKINTRGAFFYYFIGIISGFLTISIVLYLYLKRKINTRVFLMEEETTSPVEKEQLKNNCDCESSSSDCKIDEEIDMNSISWRWSFPLSSSTTLEI